MKGILLRIDAIAYFQGDRDSSEKIIFQVKSGKVKSGDIRDLQGTMSLQQSEIGIFLRLFNRPKRCDKLQNLREFIKVSI